MESLKVILISPFLIDPEQDIKLLIKNKKDLGPEGHRGLFMNGGEPMAKGKYHRWLEPEGLLKIEGWAKDGLTDEQIAHNMGVAYSSLRKWRDDFPAISAALKRGKEVVDRMVENALLKRALGYEYEEVKKKYENGVLVEQTVTKKEVIPDTIAQLFWLKNRKPDIWRDRQEITNDEALDRLDQILGEIRKNANDTEAE